MNGLPDLPAEDVRRFAQIRDDFTRMMLGYRFGMEQVTTRLDILREEFAELHADNPIEHISTRLKSPESIIAKAARQDVPLEIEALRANITDIAGIRVADLICFDVAFDDSVAAQIENGAQLVTVQTSNATFTGTSQPQQQFTISRARAMEAGRTVVVASTNGLSGVVGPDGTVRDQLAPRTTDIAVAQVPLVDAQTPATRYGSLIGQVLSLGGIAAVITAAAAASRRRLPRLRRLGGWPTRR